MINADMYLLLLLDHRLFFSFYHVCEIRRIEHFVFEGDFDCIHGEALRRLVARKKAGIVDFK